MNIRRLLELSHSPDFPIARTWMCDRLRHLGVNERILAVMGAVPRHAFVPPSHCRLAYSDLDLWVDGAFLPSPETTARMINVLKLDQVQTILEISTGMGYESSILAGLGLTVHTIDYHPSPVRHTSRALSALGLNGALSRMRYGAFGHCDLPSFDAIICNLAFSSLPTQFLNWLRVGVGVLIVPVGPAYGAQRLLVADVSLRVFDLGSVSFPPMLLEDYHWTARHMGHFS